MNVRKDFLRLDAGSEFAAAYWAQIAVREGNPQAALEALRKLPDDYAIRGEVLLRSCLERRSPSEIAAVVRQLESAVQTEPDSEQMYFARYVAGRLRARRRGDPAAASGDSRELLRLSLPHHGSLADLGQTASRVSPAW